MEQADRLDRCDLGDLHLGAVYAAHRHSHYSPYLQLHACGSIRYVCDYRGLVVCNALLAR